MAFMWVFAFPVISVISLKYCEAEPENCIPCKLLPLGKGLASEFHLKASEKGVRLVYLNLKIGNESYNPDNPLDLPDEFVPDRWVWAKTISEPMLSLPQDYSILSLGLLNFQVRSMDVQLKDQPSGCLASLDSFCQNMVVARMLLKNITTPQETGKLIHETQVVCVTMIEIFDAEEDIKQIKNHCCGMQNQRSDGSSIRCNLTVDYSSWLDTFDQIFIASSVFMAFYLPALPLALPDFVFSLQYECDKEERAEQQADSEYIQINQNDEEEEELIPVDDASPTTFSTLVIRCVRRLPDVRLSFNIKLAIMLFCVYPCVLYAQLGLYGGQKQYIDESLRKDVAFSDPSPFSLVKFDVFQIQLLGIVAFMGLILVLFLRPKDLILVQDMPCFLCMICCSIFDLPSESSNRSVGDEVHRHLKILHRIIYSVIERFLKLSLLVFKPFLWLQCTDLKLNRYIRPLCFLWSLLCFLPTLFVGVAWGAICLIALLVLSACSIVLFSPLFSLFHPSLPYIIARIIAPHTYGARNPSVLIYILFIISLALTFVNFWYNYFMLYNSCSFIGSVLGFTTVGLVLNADLVTPYAAFFLVVTTNIYICYANLQNRYKTLKKMIFKGEKKLNYNNNDLQKTISSKLFWFVCSRVLPIKTEFCLMFRNLVLVLGFLFLVAYSIASFGVEYNVSAVFSTIAVFVSGVIPALILKGITKENMFIGWEKIEIKREIEAAVREFHQENSGNSRDIEGSHSQSTNNDDTLV